MVIKQYSTVTVQYLKAQCNTAFVDKTWNVSFINGIVHIYCNKNWTS